MKGPYFVALDIGCIECGESSHILGIFTTEKAAKDVCDKTEELQEKYWSGQHEFLVISVDELNVERIPNYQN